MLLKYGIGKLETWNTGEMNGYRDYKASGLKHIDDHILYKQIRLFRIDGLRFYVNDDKIKDLNSKV